MRMSSCSTRRGRHCTNLIVSLSVTNTDMKLGWIYTLRHKKVVWFDIFWRNQTGLTSRWACGYSGKTLNLMPIHFIILRRTSRWFLCWRGPLTDCENVDCIFWRWPTMLDPGVGSRILQNSSVTDNAVAVNSVSWISRRGRVKEKKAKKTSRYQEKTRWDRWRYSAWPDRVLTRCCALLCLSGGIREDCVSLCGKLGLQTHREAGD